MAKPGTELADFLRMKRQLLRPEMILLDAQQRALADYLHRHDVATAIGVSPADYERVESGAGILPSELVLDALIDVLELTPDEAAEVDRLIAIMRGGGAPLHPQLKALLNSWPMTPAFVSDHRLTVLAANPIARVLSPIFDGGTNVLRAMYLDPRAYRMILNVADIEHVTAGWAKKLAGEDPTDATWTQILDEIAEKRPQFRAAWENDTAPAADGDFVLEHPAAGKLDLYFRRFRIEGVDQFLVTLHAEADSPTHSGLRLLKEFAARNVEPPW
jgi:MmyB-like transcription regulator ligand binding domain/Helix-turn-helix domain